MITYLPHRRKAFQDSYDSDASSYFSAVVNAGGSFDLTSINATYTEPVVKQHHSNLFAGLKTDGVWSDISEMYLLIGKTWGTSAMWVKAKGSGTLTNSGFSSGDYTAAGAGGGLLSPGSPNYINTGFADNNLSAEDRFFGFYCVSVTGDSQYAMGSYGGSYPANISDARSVPTGFTCRSGAGAATGGSRTGFTIATNRSSTDFEAYNNGTSFGTDSSSSQSAHPGNWGLFCRMDSGSPGFYFAGNLAFAAVGNGLSSTQVSNFNTRIETFMDAIGSGVQS